MNKIDFEYVCKEHEPNELYSRYCLKCGKNLCYYCAKKHDKSHQIKLFDELLINEDKFKEIKENQSKMKMIKEELSNKLDEIKMIDNKITKLTNIITELIKKIEKRCEEINSTFKFNEEIINRYKNFQRNYDIIDKIKCLNFTMNVDNLKLDTVYETMNELKLTFLHFVQNRSN